MRALPLFAFLGLAACSGSTSTTSTAAGGSSSKGTGESTSHTTASSSGTGGSTSDAASSTSSTSSGTGGSSYVPGQPISAPAGQWTWVPFDNAFCGNGTTTGIGVNPSSTPNARLLFYFEGGGACWNELFCYTLMTASFFTTGYGESDFMTEASDTTYLALPGGYFDRTAAANPFKDYSYVYVPYCTGDIHAGNNVMTYGSNKAHFVGFKNVEAYLDRIVPTFGDTDRVVIAGSSAGGFGAAYNWWQTQQAFGSKVRVDLLDDSGTPMPLAIENEGMGETTERTAWGLDKTLPAGCTQCKTSLDGLLAFYQQQFPTHRMALLSYVQDSVLPEYFMISETAFEQGLMEDQTMYFGPSNTNAKTFTVNASGHVLWFGISPSTDDTPLQQFITQMVTDDPSWASQAL